MTLLTKFKILENTLTGSYSYFIYLKLIVSKYWKTTADGEITENDERTKQLSRAVGDSVQQNIISRSRAWIGSIYGLLLDWIGWDDCDLGFFNCSVSGTGSRHPIPTDRVQAVAMNGWHVARHWATGDGGSSVKMASTALRAIFPAQNAPNCNLSHIKSQKFSGGGGWYPPKPADTNFRLTRQRSHCSCFTKRPLSRRSSLNVVHQVYLGFSLLQYIRLPHFLHFRQGFFDAFGIA